MPQYYLYCNLIFFIKVIFAYTYVYLKLYLSQEGWGLPIAEAMAMELPVIVTNYSGPTAFANDSNAYMISLESAEEFIERQNKEKNPNDSNIEHNSGKDLQSFAMPSTNHLRLLMQQVVRDSFTPIHTSTPVADKASITNTIDTSIIVSIAKQKGILARKTMEQFSPDSIVSAINERLRYHARRRGWEFPK